MTQPQSRLVDVGERCLHVREWPGSAGTVLIAHGITGCSADHTPLAQRLNDLGFHVLAADAPGCGRSDSPINRETGFGLGAFAVDFRIVLERLAQEPAHWIGVSKGGGLGIRIAGQYPQYLASLSLYDVGASLPEAMTRTLGDRLAAPPHFATMMQFREHVGRFFDRNHCPLSPERLDEIALSWSRRTDDGETTYHYDPGTASQFTGCPEDFDLWGFWDVISCPCLILRAGDSSVLPESEAREMVMRNRNAVCRESKGAGHVNMLDDRALQDNIIAFLREHQGGRRIAP